VLDAKTILDVLEDALERDPQAIKSHLGSRWTEFSYRMGDLAGQFKAITSEDAPEVAASNLEVAVNDLLEVCWDYQYIGELLDQVGETSPASGPGTEGTKRPPSPDKPDIVEVKEIANRYYSLLAQLKETADQKKGDADDHRTHP
jgi:hypothetical protein